MFHDKYPLYEQGSQEQYFLIVSGQELKIHKIEGNLKIHEEILTLKKTKHLQSNLNPLQKGITTPVGLLRLFNLCNKPIKPNGQLVRYKFGLYIFDSLYILIICLGEMF